MSKKVKDVLRLSLCKMFYVQWTRSVLCSTIRVLHYISKAHAPVVDIHRVPTVPTDTHIVHNLLNWMLYLTGLQPGQSYMLLYHSNSSLWWNVLISGREKQRESGSESPCRWECLTVRKSIWCKLLRAQECVWPLLSCSRLGSEGWQVDASLDSPSNTH